MIFYSAFHCNTYNSSFMGCQLPCQCQLPLGNCINWNLNSISLAKDEHKIQTRITPPVQRENLSVPRRGKCLFSDESLFQISVYEGGARGLAFKKVKLLKKSCIRRPAKFAISVIVFGMHKFFRKRIMYFKTKCKFRNAQDILDH